MLTLPPADLIAATSVLYTTGHLLTPELTQECSCVFENTTTGQFASLVASVKLCN